MGVVKVLGIKTLAYHGCMPQERLVGTNFITNVTVTTDFSNAIETDELQHTVDYVAITEIIREQMAQPKNLIESVAYAIAAEIKNKAHVQQVKVEVIKENAPIEGTFNQVAVELEL